MPKTFRIPNFSEYLKSEVGTYKGAIEVGSFMDVQFEECAACAAKTGTPALCEACLHNRWAVGILIKRLQKFTGVGFEIVTSLKKGEPISPGDAIRLYDLVAIPDPEIEART